MSNYQGDPFALLQYMTPMTKGGVQGRTDDMQNLLSLIMDPEYGVAQGSYDYMQDTPPEGEQYSTPILDGFLNSASPVWKLVAERISNGTIDPVEAMGEIQNALKYNDVADEDGMDLSTARSYVEKMFAEADSRKKTDDSNRKAYDTWLSNTPYAKAGLPQPTQEYSIENQNVPMSERTREALMDALMSQQTLTTESRPRNERGGQYDSRYADIYAKKKSDSSMLTGRYEAMLLANLQTALNAGRTPLQDAINARSSGLF